MKKIWLIMLSIILAAGLIFVGCGGDDDDDDSGTPPAGDDKVTITFDAGDGSFASGKTVTVEINKGATVTVPATNPTRGAHTFEGWFAGVGGTGAAFSTTTTHNANTTYYAKWEAVPNKIIITFNAGYGAFEDGTQVKEVEFNENAAIIAPTDVKLQDEYAPKKWTTNADGTGTALAGNATAAVTYYATYGDSVFSLADWFTTPAGGAVGSQFSGSGSSANPFYRSSSCIAAAVEEDSNDVKHIYVQYGTSTSGTVPGTTHGLSLAINDVSGSALELDLMDKVYFVQYKGIYHGSQTAPVPTDNDGIMVRPGNSGISEGAITFVSAPLEKVANAQFELNFIAQQPPANEGGYQDVFRLQCSPGVSVGNTPAADSVYISVYSIEIIEIGPRS